MYYTRFLSISMLGAANFYLINYMSKATPPWIKQGNTFAPDTKDEISAHINTHYLPYVKPYFKQNLAPIISDAHQDWSHEVNQWIDGGKVHTSFVYPSSLFKDHFASLIDTEPKIMFRESMSAEEITKKINGQSGITIRSNIEKFIGAHEATHINEFHPLIKSGVHTAVSTFSAYIVLANIVRAVRHPQFRGAGIALGALSAFIANHVFISTDRDIHGKDKTVLRVNPPWRSILNNVIILRLSLILENRADVGAINIINRIHKPQEALQILRAAELMFELEDLQEEGYDPSARSHPSTIERHRRVQQAILLLEKQIAEDLARQAPVQLVNTPRIIEMDPNESDAPSLDSTSKDNSNTQSDELVCGVAKNPNGFWAKNSDSHHEASADTPDQSKGVSI